jgi:hypothetical protein
VQGPGLDPSTKKEKTKKKKRISDDSFILNILHLLLLQYSGELNLYRKKNKAKKERKRNSKKATSFQTGMLYPENQLMHQCPNSRPPILNELGPQS